MLVVSAIEGTADLISLHEETAAYRTRIRGGETLAPGPGCVRSATNSATCAKSTVTSTSIRSRGGADTITVYANLSTTIEAGDGDDTVTGGPAEDLIVGGPGVDQINSGAGDDYIVIRDTGNDGTNCGDGDDFVSADLLPLDTVTTACETVSRG